MDVLVTNAQRAHPVSPGRIGHLARCAIRRLRIRTPGELAITFIGPQRMRHLNRRFFRHDCVTDVLSFRYDGEPTCLPPRWRGRQVVGEILIAPSLARAYAVRHRVPYSAELARYVVHGLLHWLGQEDRTAAERRRMRLMEDRVLVQCASR